MAEKKNPTNAKNQEIRVNPGSVIGSNYAHLATVQVSDRDITFDFIYIHAPTKTGQVTARVTMPRPEGDNVGHLIKELTKKHDNKNK